MKSLKLYNSTNTDSTTISNAFIDHYMKDANDAQLKVYLFLLRTLHTNHDLSISHIADLFNHTEKDVIRSLEYWNDKQLISLEYNALHEICGIALRDMPQILSTPLNHQTPTITLVPQPESIPAAEQALSSSIAPQPIAKIRKKPTYTMKELSQYTEDSSLQELIFIAESYLGRTLTPTDIHSLIFYQKDLNLPIDVIDYLLQYCVERNKTSFRYIDKVAINWAETGIRTPEEAMNTTAKYDDDTYTIMRLLGKTNAITDTELSYINRWKNHFCFSMDIITIACETTVLNVDKRRFIYANSILERWFQEGVHSIEDVQRLDEKFKASKQTSSQTRKGNTTPNKFNTFTQNSYDYKTLQKNLLQQ